MFMRKKQFEEIIRHSKGSLPREACGILAGRDNKVEKVYKMKNISETPKVCYFIDPKEQLTVFKEMRQVGKELMGIYHSHSTTDAYPSSRDCEMAFYSDAIYVIISLKDPGRPEMRAFRIVDGSITEEELVVL
ncbi:MAG: M67 family metallopeptidase [Actinobacteria bacterium]|nr:M67 family metallopeptidase [Actinomycetota bacterium]